MSVDPTSVYIDEAPSSIDRSSNEAYQQDAETITTGESVRLKNATFVGGGYRVVVERPDGSKEQTGALAPRWRYTPQTPGKYVVRTRDGTEIASFDVVSGSGNTDEETIGSTDDYVNTTDPTSGTEFAENTPGYVPADNERGYRLAPEFRDDSSSSSSSTSALGSEGGVIGAIGAGVLVVLAAAAALLAGGD